MKTLKQINENLENFEKEFGISISSAKQGDDKWFTMKLGVISASCASDVVAKKGTATRDNYMAELIAQVCTGLMGEEINSKAMRWGKDHEDAARSCYEFSTNQTMTQVPFVYKDGLYREGCSPDGIIPDIKGSEIKCPFASVNFVKFLTADTIKNEWDWQTQFCMRVLEAGEWDVTQYDPRMKTVPIKTLTIPRDSEKQKKLDDLVPQFISDMDDMLKKIGVRFGDQWRRVSIEKTALTVTSDAG